MFADDNLYANFRDQLRQMMAASIEALFILAPAPLVRQCCLALDNFFQTSCFFERVQFGFLINPRTLMVTLPSDKLDKIKKLVSNWHRHRKSYTLHIKSFRGPTARGSDMPVDEIHGRSYL